MKSKTEFKHESLLTPDDVRALLEALSNGLSKGQLEFSDEHEGSLKIEPEGLLQVKVEASEEEQKQQFEIKVRWERQPKALPKKGPKIS